MSGGSGKLSYKISESQTKTYLNIKQTEISYFGNMKRKYLINDNIRKQSLKGNSAGKPKRR